MTVAVATKKLGGRPAVGRATVARRAQKMLDDLGRSEAELSILLCDDETIRELNRTYRDKDRPTDVLSFPMGEGDVLGDVVISLPTAARQAPSRREGGLRDEVTRLLAHGLLHLLGWDHPSAKELQKMERETERLVALAAGRPTGG